MKKNESLDCSHEFPIRNLKSEEIKYFLENKIGDEKNKGNLKYNNSWDFYFIKNTKFEFSIEGLNKLKKDIFFFYINMFCFDEKEIKTKKNYILGLSNINDLDDVSNKCAKNDYIRLFCQIFKKDELLKISQKDDFFKLFRHYYIWCLNKSFQIGKIKNKYRKTKFYFESVQSVVDNMNENALFSFEEEKIGKIGSNETFLEEKSSDDKIELLNDEKIPNLYYELNELNNDEKNFCIIKEYSDENGSYYQGAIYNKEYTDLDSISSNSKSNNISSSNDNKNSDSKNDNTFNKIHDKSFSSKESTKKHGLGREYHLNTDNNGIRYKYLGYYKNNKFHGFGILIKENQECYYGEFRDGLKNGFGYLYTKKYIYKGFFYSDKKEGYGEFFNKEKNINYCGNFSDDKFNGYGYYYSDNKFKFFGNFKDGYLKGLGLYIWNTEDIYYGHWSSDKMNGIGIYFYKEGDIFIGNYCNDKKNGNGKYIYNGKKSMLEGEWKNGIKHGKYKFTYLKDGNTYSFDVRYVNNREIK